MDGAIEVDHGALYASYETVFFAFQACGAQQRCMEGSTETSQRLACDASLVHMRHDADGAVLDVSRKTRTIPPSIRRALAARDTGCRFPGCTSRRCDAHHLTHWAVGGVTRLDMARHFRSPLMLRQTCPDCMRRRHS